MEQALKKHFRQSLTLKKPAKKAFPDYDFYRAFTSGMIIRKWARTKNVIIHNPDEVMKRLVAEGYEEVICQPTHIINGLEYDKIDEYAFGI